MFFFQGSWAQQTPIVTLGFSEQNARLSQLKFDEPTITIQDATNAIISSRFRITYKMKASANYTLDLDGRAISTDTITDTSIMQLYGRPQIGDKAGDATVEISIKPLDVYASLYTSVDTSYVIHVQVPTLDVEVTPSETIKAIVGQVVSEPTFKLSYPDVYDLSVKHDVTTVFEDFGVVSSGIEYISLSNGNITATLPGNATLTYTFTPKPEYANTFKPFTKDVAVSVQGYTEPIKTHIVFDQTEQKVYRYPESYVPLWPKVFDEFGNDVTKYMNIVFSSPYFSSYDVIFPQTGKSGPLRADIYSSTLAQHSNAVGDVNISFSAAPIFDPLNPMSSLFASAPQASYNLNVLPRSPELMFSTDFSTRRLYKGFTYDSYSISRIDSAVFKDQMSGENQYLLYSGGNNRRGSFTYNFGFRVSDQTNFTLSNLGTMTGVAREIDGEKWIFYSSNTKQDAYLNWTINFINDGTYPMIYQIVPKSQEYDLGNYQEVELHVSDDIFATMSIDPREVVTFNNDHNFKKSNFTIFDDLKQDITDKYNISYTLNDSNGTGTKLNSIDGSVTIGRTPGTVTVTISAEKKNIEDYYMPVSGTYTILINDSTGRFAYGILDKGNPADPDQGKLYFTKEGTVPGGYTVDGVPGLKVQFGKIADIGWGVTSNNGVLAIHRGGLEFDANTGIPKGGTYYLFTPSVNGYLTVYANLVGNSNTTLLQVTNGKVTDKEVFTPTTTVSGASTFKYPLIVGNVYYLFNERSDGNDQDLILHGVTYMPAFVTSHAAEDPVESANGFVSGYTGNIPYLLTNPNEHVSFSLTGTSGATINSATGTLSFVSSGTDRISAQIASAEKSSIYKTASFELHVSDIPAFVVQNTEILSPGNILTTTNHPTRIKAIIGGWEYGIGPYYKMVLDANGNLMPKDPLIDSWKISKEDLVGHHLDGFVYQTQGVNNPTDENGKVFSAHGKTKEDLANLTSYNLPCRGTYLKFEPEESGELMVYVLQNGVCDYDATKTHNNPDYVNAKYRPLFIVDESGQSVELDNSWSYNNSHLESESGNPNSIHTGYYTVTPYRASYTDEDWNWSKFTGTTNDITDIKASIESAAKRFLSDMSWHGFTDFKQECVTSWTKLFATNEVQFTDNAIDNFLAFVDHMSCSADTYVSLGGSNGCADQLTNWDGTQKVGLGAVLRKKPRGFSL